MNSMTGFGRAESATKAGRFTIEMSGVNNRFLEISVRLPRQFSFLEHKVRELVSSKLRRGKIHLYIGFEEPDGAPSKYPVNRKAAKSYHKQLVALKKELGLAGDIELSDLLLLPEVGTLEKEALDEALIWPGIEVTVSRALSELMKMRRREGKAMAKDIVQRLVTLKALNKQIMGSASKSAERHHEKLTSRVNEMLGRPMMDGARLEEEVAMLVEKTDISEECTRFSSHIEQCRSNLKQKGPVGKKLNFILQEMNREANTMASKCSEVGITQAVISVKEEVEKLRELVQNVE